MDLHFGQGPCVEYQSPEDTAVRLKIYGLIFQIAAV